MPQAAHRARETADLARRDADAHANSDWEHTEFESPSPDMLTIMSEGSSIHSCPPTTFSAPPARAGGHAHRGRARPTRPTPPLRLQSLHRAVLAATCTTTSTYAATTAASTSRLGFSTTSFVGSARPDGADRAGAQPSMRNTKGQPSMRDTTIAHPYGDILRI
jgi:hypothetical protein